jgi:phospholipid-binding lipoprotein MlaA
MKTLKSARPILVQFGLGCILAASLSACATRPPASNPMAAAAYEDANDPLEPFNHAMFKVDAGIDKVLVRPVVKGYRFIVPPQGRKGVDNFLSNVRSPVTLTNDLLQGEFSRAGTTIGRFVLNTTMGFFGFFDVGEKLGMEPHGEDFGQTLAVWGVPNGPYLYLPFIGPSTVRDGAGFMIDSMLIDPISWYERSDDAPGWLRWADLGITYYNAKNSFMDPLDELKKSSLDYYSALRSSYRQIRAKDIRNSAPTPMEDFDQ